jgi:hypothetical protein
MKESLNVKIDFVNPDLPGEGRARGVPRSRSRVPRSGSRVSRL